jgi:uncharacterized SAM-binding protein YcdF (DUF218 family)
MRIFLTYFFFVIGGLTFFAALLIAAHGRIEELRSADVIIVLGAGQMNGEPSPVFRTRLDRAFELYHNAFSPLVILTGGIGEGEDISDSRVGKDYLIRRGIQEDHIVIEEESRTTKQNLFFAREIMNGYDARSALLVSHDFHMMRAKNMARDMGMVIFPAPVQTKNTFYYLAYLSREIRMTLLYILFRI